MSIPKSYEESRMNFQEGLKTVQEFWPQARLRSCALSCVQDLSIDWIEAEAIDRPRFQLIVTTGVHGIEGYAGAAVLELILAEFLRRLDPATTGLALVHAVNPWGMAHRRRANRENVDLNRNFLPGEDYSPAANPIYADLNSVLNPVRPVVAPPVERSDFLLGFLDLISRVKWSKIRQGVTAGQYAYPEGIYFGGEELQEESRVMIELFHARLARYPRTALLDVHCGYGPKGKLTILHASEQPVGGLCSDPYVVEAAPDPSRPAEGRLVDYFAALAKTEYPHRKVFAAELNFGTLGDSLRQQLRRLHTLILENQVYWYGAGSDRARAWVQDEFDRMLVLSEEQWRLKGAGLARRAIEGVLRMAGSLE